MTEFLKQYVDSLDLSNIIILSSEWMEQAGGNQNEYTTEEIACKKNGKY